MLEKVCRLKITKLDIAGWMKARGLSQRAKCDELNRLGIKAALGGDGR